MKIFNFEIICKKGKENLVHDALSKIEEASNLYPITFSIPRWLEEACHNGKMTIVLNKN